MSKWNERAGRVKAGRGGVDILLERRERGIGMGRGWKWGLDYAVDGYSTQDSTL